MAPTRATSRERPGRNRVREAGRWLGLIAAVALAWPLLPESSTAVILPALSPFIAVASALSVRAVGGLALLAVPVLLLVSVYPRWFCRHGCPVGWLQEWVERLRPRAYGGGRKGPNIGPWLVWLTLGGALLGYPLFLWLDPLAIFNGFLNAWRRPLAWVTLLTGLGLPLLLLLALVVPRLWCQRVCPLGAAQDLLAGPRRWFRTRSRSGESGLVSGTAEANRGRRGFLAVLAGVGGAMAVRTSRAQEPPPLRPPGALNEAQFGGVCVRCGNCARACPSRIIQPDLAGWWAAWLAPRLDFSHDYCREDCHRCNLVCPSGAIARLSLAGKRRQVIGLARVDADVCLLVLGRECHACVPACPYQAITIETGEDPFSPRPRVDQDRCNGCGACAAACPTRPVRALRVQPRRALANPDVRAGDPLSFIGPVSEGRSGETAR